MKRWLLAFALLLPSAAFGQNFAAPTSPIIDGTGHPVAGATVTVCSGSLSLPAPGTVCTPTTTIFSSFAGAAQANPFTSDGFGNWPFFGAPGNYLVSISGGPLVTYSFYLSIGNATGTPGGSPGQIQDNNSGSFGGVAGSSVTQATGATTLTAGADTTTPWSIASHSNTQSATLLDVNNQSSGTPDTPLVVRGRGTGSFTPSGFHVLLHVIEESDALAHGALSITNHAADVAKGSTNFASLGFGVNDSGIAQIGGGGVVGDAANNYWCLGGDANESLFVSICNAATGAAIVPFYVKGATSQTADLFEAKDVNNNVLAKIDKAGVVDGLLDTVATTGTSANLCTDLSQLTLNQEGTAGQAVTYTLCTAGMGKRQCVMNSNGGAANTGVLTVATSAAGQFIIFTDGTLSASGGNVTSGGAGGDGACFYGVDSTHWQMTVQQGTWTKH